MFHHFYNVIYITNDSFLNVKNNCFSIELKCFLFNMNHLPNKDGKTVSSHIAGSDKNTIKNYLELYILKNKELFYKYIKAKTFKDLNVDFLEDRYTLLKSKPNSSFYNVGQLSFDSPSRHLRTDINNSHKRNYYLCSSVPEEYYVPKEDEDE